MSQTSILITAVLLVTICAPIDGISVDCLYEMISFPPFDSLYTCTGRVLNDGNDSITLVYGTHQTGKTHQDVRALRLWSQNLQFFPRNFESFFPNIIAIDLYNNSITIVNNRHLIPFPNLEFLGLSINRITSIDGDLFDGLNSMGFIAFVANDIRHVGHDLSLPTNLPVNGGINFYSNPCISEFATTPYAVASLKLNLLRNCPPTISQIENSLERRQNLLTHIDGQVQSLIRNNEKMRGELAALRNQMNDEHETLRNEQDNQRHVLNDFDRRIEYLESMIENVIEACRRAYQYIWQK